MIEDDEEVRGYVPPDVLLALAALRAGGMAGTLTVLPMAKAGRVAFMLGNMTPARTDPDSVNFEWFATILSAQQLDGWEPATVAQLESAGFQRIALEPPTSH